MSLLGTFVHRRTAQKHIQKRTRVPTQRFNTTPDNWKMTSSALCLHQTALHPFSSHY